ncbi:hypothetical protein DID88_005580 [Monilinia fructigena]|uniref:C2H2-type domain-containing protein n=1 Tax=Monilinia fructigena TaxID=38457 RepID=A0A395J1C7_9HELO|nr:hypothetical protein DID88_005580 [Monilinia fructigena]
MLTHRKRAGGWEKVISNEAAPISNNSITSHASLTQALLQSYHQGHIYSKTVCATCSSPLDTSELLLYIKDPEIFCSKSKGPSHLPLSCVPNCGLKYRNIKDLRRHCTATDHKALHCPVPDCIVSYNYPVDSKTHVRYAHHNEKFACHQCGDLFENMTQLDSHGTLEGHFAYLCLYPDCGSMAGRIGDLIRHQACHKSNVARHPCPHCRTYRGNNGFKRKDHLRQHISNYHKIETINYIGDIQLSPFGCKQAGCASYAARKTQNLRSLDELTQHMLNQHNSSAFICDKESCDRVGLNGFDTKKLLQAHIKKDHPSPFQCTHPGCDRVGSKGWLRERDQIKHMLQKHGISE